MKKLLAVLLASALFVPAMAGSIFTNLETTGEIQTIGTLTDFGTVSERDVSARLLLGVGVDLVEDVRANVTFLNTNYWGVDATHPTANNYLDRIQVAEAYVTLSNVFNAFELKVGRQFYGDENSAVMYFGPTHYRGRIAHTNPNNTLTNPGLADAASLDAAVLTYTSDELVANIIYSKVSEENLAAAGVTGDLDTTMVGIDAKYFINSNLYAQAYLYNGRGPIDLGTDDRISNDGLWGVKAAYNDDAMAASVEFAKNYEGRRIFHNNNVGWMLKADASMNLAMEQADMKARLGYFHTEKDVELVGNYAPGIIFGGTVGPLNENNSRIINAGLDIKCASLSKITFAFDYFAISNGPSDKAEWIGNEFNLMAKYALNDYVELHAGAAYMTNVGASAIAGGFADKNEAYGGQMGMIVRF